MEAQSRPVERWRNADNEVKLKSFLNTVLRPMIDRREPYIESNALRDLQMSLIPLEFSAERLPSNVDSFFEPICPSELQAWLDDSKPWTLREKDFAYPDYDEEPLHSSPQSEAAHFWTRIGDYLTLTDDGSAKCPIPDRTNWRQHYTSWDVLNCLSKGQANWQVQILQSYSLGQDPKGGDDLTKPHIICFLTDDVRLQANKLLTSELTTISSLAYATAINLEYKEHSIIPIMVVTASSRYVRIVQGILDVKTSELELRMSEAVSFNTGIVANWQNFLTLLGWVIARPIGNTV